MGLFQSFIEEMFFKNDEDEEETTDGKQENEKSEEVATNDNSLGEQNFVTIMKIIFPYIEFREDSEYSSLIDVYSELYTLIEDGIATEDEINNCILYTFNIEIDFNNLNINQLQKDLIDRLCDRDKAFNNLYPDAYYYDSISSNFLMIIKKIRPIIDMIIYNLRLIEITNPENDFMKVYKKLTTKKIDESVIIEELEKIFDLGKISPKLAISRAELEESQTKLYQLFLTANKEDISNSFSGNIKNSDDLLKRMVNFPFEKDLDDLNDSLYSINCDLHMIIRYLIDNDLINYHLLNYLLYNFYAIVGLVYKKEKEEYANKKIERILSDDFNDEDEEETIDSKKENEKSKEVATNDNSLGEQNFVTIMKIIFPYIEFREDSEYSNLIDVYSELYTLIEDGIATEDEINNYILYTFNIEIDFNNLNINQLQSDLIERLCDSDKVFNYSYYNSISNNFLMIIKKIRPIIDMIIYNLRLIEITAPEKDFMKVYKKLTEEKVVESVIIEEITKLFDFKTISPKLAISRAELEESQTKLYQLFLSANKEDISNSFSGNIKNSDDLLKKIVDFPFEKDLDDLNDSLYSINCDLHMIIRYLIDNDLINYHLFNYLFYNFYAIVGLINKKVSEEYANKKIKRILSEDLSNVENKDKKDTSINYSLGESNLIEILRIIFPYVLVVKAGYYNLFELYNSLNESLKDGKFSNEDIYSCLFYIFNYDIDFNNIDLSTFEKNLFDRLLEYIKTHMDSLRYFIHNVDFYDTDLITLIDELINIIHVYPISKISSDEYKILVKYSSIICEIESMINTILYYYKMKNLYEPQSDFIKVYNKLNSKGIEQSVLVEKMQELFRERLNLMFAAEVNMESCITVLESLLLQNSFYDSCNQDYSNYFSSLNAENIDTVDSLEIIILKFPFQRCMNGVVINFATIANIEYVIIRYLLENKLINYQLFSNYFYNFYEVTERIINKVSEEHTNKEIERILSGDISKEKTKSEELFELKNVKNGYEFEEYIARLYKNIGHNVDVTPKSGDQGADIIIEKDGIKEVVQTKFYSYPVGNKAVQEVTAAIKYYDADGGIVITNNTFTKSAKELAEKNKIKLIDKKGIKKLIESIK